MDRISTKNVPAGKEAVIRWKVKLLKAGKFQVKVSSSTGLSQTKTITIAQPTSPTGDHVDVQLQGDFAPGKSFQVIAKVRQPTPGQTLALELPKGLDSLRGELVKAVPTGANSSVAWSVKILEPGKFPIKVLSSTGIAVKKTLTIDTAVSNQGDFTMAIEGVSGPGKDFRILAKVAQPAHNQVLTLVLPDGIKLLEGTAAWTVPPADSKGFSIVSWNVRLERAGTLQVRIESNTGQVKTRTISTTIY